MNSPKPLMLAGALLLGWLAPAVVSAQSTSQAPSTALSSPSEPSKLWLVAGGAFATLRGDCEAPPSPLSPITCDVEFQYRHSGSLFGNIGYRVSDRLDVGAELFWMPTETASGNIRVTHVDGIAQFRPWSSQGFFLKGGAGMAFLRNWVDAIGPASINQKALSVVIGTGWVFRPHARLGWQVVGAQHFGAVGDVPSPDGLIENVTANFWSFGAALVIR